MDNIIVILMLCSALLAVASMFYKDAFFIAPQGKRERATGFVYYGLITITLFIAYGLIHDVKTHVETPSIVIIVFFMFFSLSVYWTYKLRKNIPKVQPVQIKSDAPLPEGNTLRVQSRSTRGRFYDLNLDELTCTCQDWQEERTTQPKTMPGRLCKHLLSAVLDKPDILPPHLAQFYALFEPVAREGRGMPVPSPRLSVCYGVRDDGIPFVLTHEPGSPWANVIVQGQRYGYNAEEDRWSYQRAPEDAAFWKGKLRTFF